MFAPREVARTDQVTVGQQHRVLGFVRAYLRGEHRHDVRPVGVVGDEAIAFRFALRAKVAGGLVKAREFEVVLGLELGHHAEGELGSVGG